VCGSSPTRQIPELLDSNQTLTLNLDIIVSIYFNRITYWDDSEVALALSLSLSQPRSWTHALTSNITRVQIAALNSGISLPPQPIRTIMQTSYSCTCSQSRGAFITAPSRRACADSTIFAVWQ
jgi:outer membrane usher protein FimD/PapC